MIDGDKTAKPVSCIGVVLTSFSACARMNRHYDASKAHHTPEGFRNTAPTRNKSTAEFLRWQRERRQLNIAAPTLDLSAVAPDLEFVQNNRTEFAVTYIGHATVLVQIGGVNLVTDPHFSERAFPVQFAGTRRWQPPGVALADLPHIDVVLVSHNHYDHLDTRSIVALRRQAEGPPLFLVPLGIDRWMRSAGIDNFKAMDWWQHHSAGALTVTMVPAQHWSQRTLSDRNQSLWGGFVGQVDGRSFYFAGDTGYGPDFVEIGRRFAGLDVALIPIGAYEPRWFMSDSHVNPEEAIRIHRDVKARKSIGIHWGTFLLTDEPLDRPLADLAIARDKQGISDDEFLTLRHGQTLKLEATP